jgi:glutamate carboxypeptidase
LRARFPASAISGEPGILMMSHLDTVHPVGTLEKLPFRRDGRALLRAGHPRHEGRRLCRPAGDRRLWRRPASRRRCRSRCSTRSDEEIGSPGTRELILERRRAVHRYVLVPEPGRPGDGVVTGRYAIARFNLLGRGPAEPCRLGRSRTGAPPSTLMARKLLAIEAMTGERLHLLGRRHPGRASGSTACRRSCRAEALSMAKRQDDLDRGVERMLALAAEQRRR